MEAAAQLNAVRCAPDEATAWSVPTGEPLPRVLAKQDGPEVREETEL
jgi:hypothetical protein